MPIMNFDLNDGLPPISLTLNPADCLRFMAFLDECQAIKESRSEQEPANRVTEAAATLQEICHTAAANAGWWSHLQTGERITDNPYCFSNKLCLIHSEISEAMEGDRKALMDEKLPNRPMREVELADAVIRIFDLAGAYGMDLGGAIAEKLEYNASRADHKPENRAGNGGKKF